jgi:hypothetical protein
MSSKNWTQKKVNKCRTITELLVPLIFGFIIGLAVKYSHITPSAYNIDSVLTFWLLILFFAPFMYIQGVIFILNQMVADRETKMRETLKIMGLGRVSYGMSYLAMQGLLALLGSVILLFCLWYPIRDQSQYV